MLAKKLTVVAALTGAVIGLALYLGVGRTGLAMMAAFFLMGTAATSWKRSVKQSLGLVEPDRGRRNAGQVVANGGAGGLLGLLAVLFPQAQSLLLLLTAASFSSAAADTLSSELGSVYGRKFYDVLTFRPGVRGRDGVVSVQGFLFGAAGSAVIALLYLLHNGHAAAAFSVVLAGTVGNLADSVLGATLERKGVVGNNAVNFLNTTAALLTAFLLYQI